MQNNNHWQRHGLSVFLIISIIALLIFYNGMARNLSAQIYTPVQQDLLSYSSRRVLLQSPIVTNRYETMGAMDTFFPLENNMPVVPANFSVWENRVNAILDASYEEENGVSLTRYDLNFNSEYHFQYSPAGITSTLEIIFPFPSNLETLNDVTLLVDGEEPQNVEYTYQQIRWLTELVPGDEHDVLVHYRADGVNSFTYGLSRDRRTDLLDVSIVVNGLQGSETSDQSLPTTHISQTENSGETLNWHYDKLLANRDIQLTLPRKLSFAQKVAALQDDFRVLGSVAPFWVGLFLASLAGLMHLKGMRLELPAYLLAGLGLTLFYPLLIFTSGLVGAILAAVITLILVVGLLTVFLWYQVKSRSVILQILWLAFIFLVMLSLGMLTPYRGILLTLGGFLLVGTFMLAYAKRPLPPPTTISELTFETVSGVSETTSHIYIYCPQCGRSLDEEFDYCPSCSYDARQIHHCPTCHHEQIIPEETDLNHCVHCGANLSG